MTNIGQPNVRDVIHEHMTKDKCVRPFCTLYKLDRLHSYSLYGHR